MALACVKSAAAPEAWMQAVARFTRGNGAGERLSMMACIQGSNCAGAGGRPCPGRPASSDSNRISDLSARDHA